jgi:hypothetical protein
MIAAPTDMRHTLLPARVVCAGEGYAMVRRPRGAVPFIVTEEEWERAPLRA